LAEGCGLVVWRRLRKKPRALHNEISLVESERTNLPEYRNPQQEPGGQSRMTLVLVVTFALILIGQFVLIKNKAKNAPPKAPSTPTAAE
jgi:hypothetical protein